MIVTIETIVTIVFQFSINNWIADPVYINHYYSASRLIAKLLTYTFTLLLISNQWSNFSYNLEKIKKFDWKIILLLVITALGYEFFSKPLWDIKLIINATNKIDLESINNATDNLYELSRYTFIRGVIIAPILEELFFRKVLFKGLSKQNSFVISVIVSSLCFASIHIIPDWQNVLPTFIFGVISCLIYNHTKNILYPILFHFTCNLITYILVAYHHQIFIFQPEYIYKWQYWLACIAGVGFTLFGLRKIKQLS